MKKLITIPIILLGIGVFQGSASAKIAPGCTPDKPTFIGGTFVGYPDNRALDGHIGVSVGYKDSTGKFHDVIEDGSPIPNPGNYSYVEHMNSTLPATGSDVGIRNWGRCVAPNVTTFYFEGYPKDPPDLNDPKHNTIETQKTDKIRYGTSAYYNGTVTAGQTLNVLLRLPVTYEAGGGNTGGIQGYITYHGQYVPKENITSVRAFPGSGVTCGVEGYSAAADSLTTSTNPNRTYYKLNYLAGGQCGATVQYYSFQMTCITVCGVARKTFVKRIGITKGLIPRFDVAFS
jgi:hypothetical protein